MGTGVYPLVDTRDFGAAAAYSPTDREVSPTLSALLGREPRSLSDFLADHGAAFRPSAHS